MRIAIQASGIHLPRERLLLSAIAAGNGWFTGKGRASGSKSRANWDEDAVTMAVAAARAALGQGGVDALWLASTTPPFTDRLNAGIAIAALGGSDAVQALDFGGSQRAGTSALATALRQTGAGRTVVAAAERRVAPAGSPAEQREGDGAAALVVGPGPGIAELVAAASVTVDFADHYRATGFDHDYQWEERWLRDEGHGRILHDALSGFMAAQAVDPAQVHHLILPAGAGALAARLGIAPTALAPDHTALTGDLRTAQPLIMLHDVLCRAAPGQNILLAGFGYGVDVLWLRTGDAITDWQRGAADVASHLARTVETDNYLRHLALNGLLVRDLGLRAEADLPAPPTEMFRSRRALLGFEGGCCSACGQVQFPPQDLCVNPACRGDGTVRPYRLADEGAVLQSVTADHLTFSPDPPARYGMVRFDAGGSLMMDLTDAAPADCTEGSRLRFVFRIRDIDRRRGNRRYFWKAVPQRS